LGEAVLSESIVQEGAFERAQDRAREERLRKAVEREMDAHRSLCVHYNAALEQIVKLEDRVAEMATLTNEVLNKDCEIKDLHAALRKTRSKGLRDVVLLVSFFVLFASWVAYKVDIIKLIISTFGLSNAV
jgi:hypothetical protein